MTRPAAVPSLAVVIPVWNDESGLAALLAQIARMGVFDQVVIVDDASDRPADPARLGLPYPPGAELIFLRNAQRRGAGHARNRGLARVTAERVIFFDSDDRFASEFGPLTADLGRLAVDAFDLCLFSHADSRVAAAGGWGPMPDDLDRWRRAGIFGALAPLPEGALPGIIQIAAYPWNKVYRTAFLREHGLRCTETMVHNDIELHWTSLLAAGRILVSDRVGALHRVEMRGTRLTNQSGAERLEVTRALAPVARAVAAAGPDFTLPFIGFVLRLTEWGLGQLDPALHDAYRGRMREVLAGAVDLAAFRRIAGADPALADELCDRLAWMPEETS